MNEKPIENERKTVSETTSKTASKTESKSNLKGTRNLSVAKCLSCGKPMEWRYSIACSEKCRQSFARDLEEHSLANREEINERLQVEMKAAKRQWKEAKENAERFVFDSAAAIDNLRAQLERSHQKQIDLAEQLMDYQRRSTVDAVCIVFLAALSLSLSLAAYLLWKGIGG